MGKRLDLTQTTRTRPIELPMRPCVGIMLINRFGRVWVGRRSPKWFGDRSGHIWQMPQGGILRDEPPLTAAFRELEEETAATSVELLAEASHWLTYELPDDLMGVALKGRYRGQRQLWFAMRFVGSDHEFDIRARKGHKAEFDSWRWAELDELPSLIVAFKRPLYEAIIAEFGHLARR